MLWAFFYNTMQTERENTMTKQESRKRNSSRFTILELLIVISVIAILASLLLPALNKAKQAAFRVTCINNFKQLFNGITLYHSDNDGWMPPASENNKCGYSYYINYYLKTSGGTAWESGSWAFPSSVLLFRERKGPFFCQAIPDAANSPVWNGSTPSDKYFTNYVPTKRQAPVSEKHGGWKLDGKVYRKADMIKNSSIILGEANWFSMDGANKPVGWLYQGQWTDSSKMPSDSRYAPAWVHNLSANFLRVDGSTRTLRFTGGSLFDEDFIIRK